MYLTSSKRSLSTSAAAAALLCLAFLLPSSRYQARASHTGASTVLQISGADACAPQIEQRAEKQVQPHEAIVIVGDEGPAGFILGRDPLTGQAIPRPASGVTAGSGTFEDPYVIEGWLIEQRNVGITIRDTTAHVIVRDNRLAHNASHAISIQQSSNVTVTSNTAETNVGSGVNIQGPVESISILDNSLVADERGISLLDAADVDLKRNAIVDSRSAGIQINGGSDVEAVGNVIDNPGTSGMSIAGSPGSHIRCNRITEAIPVGIDLTNGSSDAQIARNIVTDNGFGMMISHSPRARITENEVARSAGSSESSGIWVFESDDVEILRNELSEGQFSGVTIRRSYGSLVEENTFADHTWGIFCTGNTAGAPASSPDGAERNVFRDNVLRRHSRSIVMHLCSRNVAEGNVMTSQEFDGIHDFEGEGNIYRGNVISEAPRAGIYLWRFGNHAVSENEIFDVSHGIRLYDVRETEVVRNAIRESDHGVVVNSGAEANMIVGNTLARMSGAGVYLLNGADTIVTKNGLIGNRIGILVGGNHPGGTATQNDIRGNTEAGLLVQREAHFPAPENWWGCSDGPGDPACDGVQGNAQVAPWLTFPVPGIDRPPLLAAIDDVIADAGGTITIAVTASDPDGDAIHLDVLGLPKGADFHYEGGGRGWLHWETNRGNHGTYILTFRATSGGLSDTRDVAIEVRRSTGPPENQGPSEG